MVIKSLCSLERGERESQELVLIKRGGVSVRVRNGLFVMGYWVPTRTNCVCGGGRDQMNSCYLCV